MIQLVDFLNQYHPQAYSLLLVAMKVGNSSGGVDDCLTSSSYW